MPRKGRVFQQSVLHNSYSPLNRLVGPIDVEGGEMSAVTHAARAVWSAAAGTLLAAAPALSQGLPYGFETVLRPTSDQYSAVSTADFGVVAAKDGDTLAVGTRGSIHVFVRTGGIWELQQTLTELLDTRYGERLALSGDTLVAGASFESVGGLGGATYVYVRAGGVWSRQQKLAGNGIYGGSEFGGAVAIEGDTLLVGAPREPSLAGVLTVGAVHVFARTGSVWSEVQRLEPPDGVVSGFGQAVALSGDTAVIGAPFRTGTGGSGSGAAYVFTRTGTVWAHQQTLEASDAAASDQFGTAVDVDADRLVVGAIGNGPNEEGAAYPFVRAGGTWTPQPKLVGLFPQFDRCGTDVAVAGDAILMGCTSHEAYAFAWSGSAWVRETLLGTAGEPAGDAVAIDGNEAVSGSHFVEVGIPPVVTMGPDVVTLFTRSGSSWTPQSRLYNPDSTRNDAFGQSLALEGDLLAIGAPNDRTVDAVGSVTIYSHAAGSWSRVAKVTSATPAGSTLGTSVALEGNVLVAGARGPFGSGGHAFVYEGGGSTWTPTMLLTPQDGHPNDAFGTAVAISGNTVIVGASDGVGAAYPFAGSGAAWSQQGKLVAPDGQPGDSFGRSVAISGDTIVVGSAASLPGIDFAGAAYVFVRSGATWSFAQKLTAPDATASAAFGGAVAIEGNEIVVGAAGAAAAYVFVRAGGTWTFTQRLAVAGEGLGAAVALDGDQLAIAASVPPAPPSLAQTAAVHIFRRAGGWVDAQRVTVAAPNGFLHAVVLDAPALVASNAFADDPRASTFRQGPTTDLAVSLVAPASAVAGEAATLSVAVSNQGAEVIAGARVSEPFPPPLANVTWTCSASPGSACAATGSGSLSDVVTIAPGGTLTYGIAAQVRADAKDPITTTATVAPPPGTLDSDPLDDASSATIQVARRADLSIDKTDGRLRVAPGTALSYTLTVRNPGPSRARATVVDTFPAAYTGATWTCAAEGGSVCHQASGSGNMSSFAAGTVQPGHSITFTTNGTVSPGATGTLSNTAQVFTESGVDPVAANNSDTDLDLVTLAAAELTPGASAVDSFAVPSPHHYWIAQQPYASYEIVLDAQSGPVGALALDRLGATGTTVLQSSTGVGGAGFARSLRFRNDRSIVVDHELVRVASAGCSSGCGGGDGYRVRAYETTGRISRFNNSGTQGSVVILQNTAAVPVAGTVYFWGPDGALRARSDFALEPRAGTVLVTGSIAALQGTSGSITVGHDGPCGSLAGKAVSLDPSTGFSFDSVLEPVRR